MIRLFAIALSLLALGGPASAIELIGALRESVGGTPPAGAPAPCSIGPYPYVPGSGALNGTCANYRWFNLCSGYIWIFSFNPPGDMMGTLFKEADGLGCVAAGNSVKRAVTYWRNVVPNYNQTVDVFLNADPNGDGCPPFTTLAQDLNLDPGLRWNCSNFGTVIPAGVNALVVRFTLGLGTAPTFATDGPYTQTCDPNGNDHSFYYPSHGGCIPVRQASPTGRGDNFLTWLVIDSATDATEPASWGKIKGLFR
jgi:hypothetical protein